MSFKATTKIGEMGVIIDNEERVWFTEGTVGGHIGHVPLSKIKIRGVEKLYQGLNSEGYSLPELEEFKTQWEEVLREYKKKKDPQKTSYNKTY
ncbi:MAG: hypothetical protein ABIE55_04790 [Candidatus Aenigmatarchaeota archaeon]